MPTPPFMRLAFDGPTPGNANFPKMRELAYQAGFDEGFQFGPEGEPTLFESRDPEGASYTPVGNVQAGETHTVTVQGDAGANGGFVRVVATGGNEDFVLVSFVIADVWLITFDPPRDLDSFVLPLEPGASSSFELALVAGEDGEKETVLTFFDATGAEVSTPYTITMVLENL